MTLTLRPRDLDLSFQQKINRIIQLWQKYNVFDQELIDSLNRIAATASIDSVLNGSAANVSLNDSATTTLSAPPPPPPPTSSSKNKKRSGEEAAKHVKKLKRLKYLQEKLLKQQAEAALSPTVDKAVDSELISEMHKLTHQLLSQSKTKPKSHASSSPITNEISKVSPLDQWSLGVASRDSLKWPGRFLVARVRGRRLGRLGHWSASQEPAA